MIEVIYKEEKQEGKGNETILRIPRNIRQIGLVNGDYRIYIEDYVYTFLGRLSGAEMNGEGRRGSLAVLLGEAKWAEGITCLFIRGALIAEHMEVCAEHIDFTDEIWREIHEEQEKYFPDEETVGWFFSQPQLPLEMTELFTRVHLKYFGGEKVFMLMEPVEKEDAFFRYEGSCLAKQEGYYIYYEKNPLMQAYMLEKNQQIEPVQAEEVEDEAVKTFRKIIKGKKKQETEENGEPQEKPSVFSYAATACLAIAVLAVGANFYRNYQDMQGVRRQVEAVSTVIEETKTASTAPEEDADYHIEELEEEAGGQTPAADAESITGTGEAAAEENGENAGTASAENPTGESAGEGSGSKAAEQNSGKAAGETNGTDSGTGAQENSGTGGQADSGTDVQENSATGTTDGDAAASAAQGQDSSDVYQEEADVRKAQRRENLAAAQDSTGTAGEAATEEDATTGNNAASDSSTTESAATLDTYVIRPGDTLYQISIARYGDMSKIQEICTLNGLTPEEIIYPGQVIVLP